MGLGYFSIFLGMFLASLIAFFLLKKAWIIWRTARLRIWAIIPLILGCLCAYFAIYPLLIIYKEGFYTF